MASTDGASEAGVARRGDADTAGHAVEYSVPDWVRVRRESFGLLFYDTRTTDLTFVRSGETLSPPPLKGGCRVLRICPPEARCRPAVARVLRTLADKGLIVATEV